MHPEFLPVWKVKNTPLRVVFSTLCSSHAWYITWACCTDCIAQNRVYKLLRCTFTSSRQKISKMSPICYKQVWSPPPPPPQHPSHGVYCEKTSNSHLVKVWSKDNRKVSVSSILFGLFISYNKYLLNCLVLSFFRLLSRNCSEHYSPSL